MTSSREKQADSDMFNLAREALRLQGHDVRLTYKPTVLRLVRTYILDYEMTDSEALRAFVKRFGAGRVVAPKFTVDRAYRLDPAMQRLALRAASQPPIIPVNSKKELSK